MVSSRLGPRCQPPKLCVRVYICRGPSRSWPCGASLGPYRATKARASQTPRLRSLKPSLSEAPSMQRYALHTHADTPVRRGQGSGEKDQADGRAEGGAHATAVPLTDCHSSQGSFKAGQS